MRPGPIRFTPIGAIDEDDDEYFFDFTDKDDESNKDCDDTSTEYETEDEEQGEGDTGEEEEMEEDHSCDAVDGACCDYSCDGDGFDDFLNEFHDDRNGN